jgi:hypothetical protein
VIDGARQGIRTKDLGDSFSSNAIPKNLAIVAERPATLREPLPIDRISPHKALS